MPQRSIEQSGCAQSPRNPRPSACLTQTSFHRFHLRLHPRRIILEPLDIKNSLTNEPILRSAREDFTTSTSALTALLGRRLLLPLAIRVDLFCL